MENIDIVEKLLKDDSIPSYTVEELEEMYREELDKPFEEQDLEYMGELSDAIMSIREINPKIRLQHLQKVSRKVSKRHRFIAVAACALLTSFLLFAVTATISNPEIWEITKKIYLASLGRPITEKDNKEIIATGDTRFYNSMGEMRKAENLKFRYPVKVPNGYKFTDFEVSGYGKRLTSVFYGLDPYLFYGVEIGTNKTDPNSYSYETNGIKYNIDEIEDGKYQAWWFEENDYYWIVSEDKAVLSEIIENLTED